MIVLISGATNVPRSLTRGYLVEPKRWGIIPDLDRFPWAIDNGAYSGFDEGAYVRMLERHAIFTRCLFATAPDVVGDAAATLVRWPFWSRLLIGLGLKPAFVAQDGITADRVPWDALGALFIGGTNTYKDSTAARDLCGYAKARGVWVHWGRVNGKRRYELATKAGADSIDGSGFSMYPDECLPRLDKWARQLREQPELGI